MLSLPSGWVWPRRTLTSSTVPAGDGPAWKEEMPPLTKVVGTSAPLTVMTQVLPKFWPRTWTVTGPAAPPGVDTGLHMLRIGLLTTVSGTLTVDRPSAVSPF